MTNDFLGDRIYLKLLETEDLSDDVMLWFQDTYLMQYYTNSKKVITKDSLMKSINEGIEAQNNFTYGIFDIDNNECIGTIKLGIINHVHKISDLVILIGNKKYHGKGYSVEAIKLGNRIAFEKHDLRKLFGGMYASNIASIKAYTRAGWVIEGTLKGHYLVDGKSEDRILVGCFNPKYFEVA